MEPGRGSASHHLVPVPVPEPTRPPTSIFTLPPEIRQEIWEYALPDKRILQPRGRFDLSLRDWTIELEVIIGSSRQPSLTQVCQETRHFMLRNGDFIFGKGPTEPGLWWNSKIDTLIFTYEWDLRFETNALEGLRGLDKVKNVIIDEESAGLLSVVTIFPKMSPETYDPDGPSDNRPGGCCYPVGFRSCYPDSTDIKFFLFNGINPDNLTVLFRGLSPYQDGGALSGPSGEDFDYDSVSDVRVDFHFLDDEVDDVVRKLDQFRTLWERNREPSQYSGWGERYSSARFWVFDVADNKPGPLLRKGASDEDGSVVRVSYFIDGL